MDTHIVHNSKRQIVTFPAHGSQYVYVPLTDEEIKSLNQVKGSCWRIETPLLCTMCLKTRSDGEDGFCSRCRM